MKMSRAITSRLKDNPLRATPWFPERVSSAREVCRKSSAKFVTARVGDHEAADNATHAMTYKDDRPVMRKVLSRASSSPEQQG